jgi:hypothetical protein
MTTPGEKYCKSCYIDTLPDNVSKNIFTGGSFYGNERGDMKALSLTQPMAKAIFYGKDIENRTWPTKFRGRVIIHASKKFNMEHYKLILANRLIADIAFRQDFVQGALIGEVDIVDCVQGHSSSWAFNDQYNFILANPVLYEKSIPCKGMLGFFKPRIETKGGI